MERRLQDAGGMLHLCLHGHVQHPRPGAAQALQEPEPVEAGEEVDTNVN